MGHTSTKELQNGSAFVQNQDKPDYNFPTPAANQLEEETGKPLSQDGYMSISEPYRDTHIHMHGNTQQGYIATLGPYRIIQAATFNELVASLDNPTTADIIHLINVMIESYHNYVTNPNNYKNENSQEASNQPTEEATG